MQETFIPIYIGNIIYTITEDVHNRSPNETNVDGGIH